MLPAPARPIEAPDAASFDSMLQQSPVAIVVDFWAPWCGPCLAVAPVLDQIAAERAGELKVVKVNVDEEPGLAVRFGVSGIPTIVLFQSGRPVAGTLGTRGKTHLEKALGLPSREGSPSAPNGRLRGLIARLGLRS
jgi:thioredoxin